MAWDKCNFNEIIDTRDFNKNSESVVAGKLSPERVSSEYYLEHPLAFVDKEHRMVSMGREKLLIILNCHFIEPQ